MAGGTRKCGSKVRTGCITCKIRHVRCDELKPNCRNCTSTGRKCDGYEFIRSDRHVLKRVRPRRPQGKAYAPEPTQLSPIATFSPCFNGTVQERRIFHRFVLHSIPAFAGSSEREFWTNLVIQAATQELVIRDAVIALGTLHEEFELGNGQYDQTTEQHRHSHNATVLYGKALRQLRKRIDSSPKEMTTVALIVSVLFTCFETLRRNNMAARVHYQAGMREIMRQIRRRHQPSRYRASVTTAMKKSRLQDSPGDDLNRMLQVFARLDIQACTFAIPEIEALELDILGTPPESIPLAEVRSNLEILLVTIYQLVKAEPMNYRYRNSLEVPPSWYGVKRDALTSFKNWLTVTESSIPSDLATLSNYVLADARCMLGLLLQVKIALIMLQTSIDCGHETTLDAYYNDFEDMVEKAERLTTALGFTESEPLGMDNTPFTMELGLVYPMFFIACKCRDWDLRRRAIVQLRKAGKEGIWEGPIVAVVARRVVTQEEQGLEYGESVPELARVHGVWKEVCCESRQVTVTMKLAQDETWQHWNVIREAVPF